MHGMDIGILIRQLHRSVRGLLDERLKEVGISESQMEYFMVITENEGINQKQLAEQLSVGKTSSTKAVKKLIDLGLVTRELDPDDNRNYKIYATQKGKSMTESFKQIFLKAHNGIMADFTEEELDQFHSMLVRMLDKVSAARDNLS
jgi:DNA-binding MarR family transcriptional regulator